MLSAVATARILFIEDDRSGRELGEYNLEAAGYEVDACESGAEGLSRFDDAVHQMVITDVRMPGVSGMEVLAEVMRRSPTTPVVVITAYANVELAVEAMKAGAFDFIGKPFNRDQLLLTVARALEHRSLREEVEALRIKASGVERPIVSRSDAMQRKVAEADRAAGVDTPVLITGERGTGKELLARRIHVRSARAEHPFCVLHCATMGPEAAGRALEDALARAEQGTLFVDEVTSLPQPEQGRLVRVLEEQTYVTAAGEAKRIDVRLVASTHQPPDESGQAARLREDLRFRLDVARIDVPPLRSRPDDIEPLVRHFVRLQAPEREAQITDEILGRLRGHDWPGNVRELQNACERLVLLSPDDVLSVDVLPASKHTELDGWPPLPSDGLSLVDLELSVIERVLRLKNWNVSQAAAYLRVPRHVLAYRMEKYGIKREG